jgi:hypothetical protein
MSWGNDQVFTWLQEMVLPGDLDAGGAFEHLKALLLVQMEMGWRAIEPHSAALLKADERSIRFLSCLIEDRLIPSTRIFEYLAASCHRSFPPKRRRSITGCPVLRL